MWKTNGWLYNNKKDCWAETMKWDKNTFNFISSEEKTMMQSYVLNIKFYNNIFILRS